MNEYKNSPPQKHPRYENFDSLNKDELIAIYHQQKKYIQELEAKVNCINGFDNDDKDKALSSQSAQRENVLVLRLACKEQEVQEYVGQIHHAKKVQNDAALMSLRQSTLEPGVNLLFGKMREELQQTKDKLEQAQSELSAWKFTPDSQNGKKLIARCRTLINENQELGRQLSQGKTAQLEAELALQKKYTEELRCSQEELNEFVIQLDEEVEGMQSTIQALQQQLAATKQDTQQSRELIQHYENAARLKQEIENETASSQASSSGGEDQSNSESESEVNDDRPRSSESSRGSYEEGEYVSGPDNEDNASVTSYNEQIDEYEILESVASDPEELDNVIISSTYTTNDDIQTTVDERRRKRSSSHTVERRSRSPDNVTINDVHIVAKTSRSSQKETRTYVSSACTTKSASKRRVSSDKQSELTSQSHNNDSKIRKRRRSSDQKLRTDCRIVVSSHSDNAVVVNSS